MTQANSIIKHEHYSFTRPMVNGASCVPGAVLDTRNHLGSNQTSTRIQVHGAYIWRGVRELTKYTSKIRCMWDGSMCIAEEKARQGGDLKEVRERRHEGGLRGALRKKQHSN